MPVHSYSDPGILEKRKATKIFIERFFSHIRKLKASKRSRKTGAKRHLRSNPVTNTYRNIKPQEIISQYA